jgi:predicted Zn-dependent peptidase
MKNELVTDEELKKVKDYIAGRTLLGLETSDARAEYCGSEEAMKKEIEKPEEYVKKVSKVTAKDVQKLAKEIFKNEVLNMAIVGKFKDARQFQDILKV